MLIYLASPYSHPDAAVREARYQAVIEYAAKAARVGQCVISPIAHWHPIAVAHSLPTPAADWEYINTQLIRHCAAVWVLKLDGWAESVGVEAEIALAYRLFVPVLYVDPAAPVDPSNLSRSLP